MCCTQCTQAVRSSSWGLRARLGYLSPPKLVQINMDGDDASASVSDSGVDSSGSSEGFKFAKKKEADRVDSSGSEDVEGYRRQKARRRAVVVRPKRPKVEKWVFADEEVAKIWTSFVDLVTADRSRFAHLHSINPACEERSVIVPCAAHYILIECS